MTGADVQELQVLVDQLLADLGRCPNRPTRKGAIIALDAIVQFLAALTDTEIGALDDGRVITVDHAATSTLKRLAAALGDLHHGIVDPIVAAERPQSRPLSNAATRADRQMAAVAYRVLCDDGHSSPEAARKVAKTMNAMRKKSGDSEGITATKVIGWAKRYGPPVRKPRGK